jgi:hypothetical protein
MSAIGPKQTSAFIHFSLARAFFSDARGKMSQNLEAGTRA